MVSAIVIQNMNKQEYLAHMLDERDRVMYLGSPSLTYPLSILISVATSLKDKDSVVLVL